MTKMGVNLPGMLVKTLLDESVEEMNHEVKSSALFVNERMCLDDWFRGYISTNEFYQLLDTADIRFVDDEEDPCPQNAFEREFKVKRMRKPFMKCYLRVRALVR